MINYSIYIASAQPGTKKEDITQTKAYGSAQVHEVFDLEKFAKHITDHGCAYDEGDVTAILKKTTACIREQMLAGNKVKLGDLGDFHVELDTEGAVTTEDFSSTNIKNVNIRWTPSDSFKNLRREATFQLVPSRKLAADAIEVIKNTDTIQGLE